MALQFTRALRRLATVPLYRTSAVHGSRFATTKPADGKINRSKILLFETTVYLFSDDTIPGDMEQATGLERKELEALMDGKEVISK